MTSATNVDTLVIMSGGAIVGAIVSAGAGTAQGKKEALEAAGVKVGKTPSETAALMREVFASL